MNEGMPHKQPAKSKGSTATAQDTEHRALIHLIARFAVLISVAYGIFYSALGFQLLAVKTATLASVYLGVLWASKRPNSSATAKYLIHVCRVGAYRHLGFAFLPTATGLHFWVLVIPFFCLITLNKRDWYFAGIFSAIACSSMVFLEWHRDGYRPPFEVELSQVLVPYIRAFSIFGVVVFVTGIFWSFHRRLARARREARKSFERSESLLLNILPITIADRLKNREGFIADDIDEASVLFCDLVGFTDLASNQSALETVEMLNEIFWAFDQAIEKRGLKRLKPLVMPIWLHRVCLTHARTMLIPSSVLPRTFSALSMTITPGPPITSRCVLGLTPDP